jgi:hypothetical protein
MARRWTLLTLLFSACGSPSTSPSDLAVAGDSAVPVLDMVVLSTDLAGRCNNLNNSAPVIQETMVNQPMPMATVGGTIASGLYYLTASTAYQGAATTVGSRKLQITELVNGATVEIVESVNGAVSDGNRTFSSSGTTLTDTSTCPGNFTVTFGVDGTSAKYTTYDYGVKVVYEWTRQ